MKEHDHGTRTEPEAEPARGEVAEKAYAIYVKEGRPEGHAEQNWREAEAQMQHAKPDHPDQHDEHDDHAHMAADFQKRFWIALVLTLPILVLSPMLQTLVGLREAIGFSGDSYVLFGLSSAVFWYGGWPFLKGFLEEVKSRRPGMMMLIVAVSTAYLYSSAVVFGLAGKMFFWELASLIDIMLLGHWIEMRSVMGASRALEELAKLMPSDPAPQWLTMDDAVKHCAKGIGIWQWASNDQGVASDAVMACCGDVPTLETLAAVSIMREHLPDLRIRVVNVIDLIKLQPQTKHPHGLSDTDFDEIFTKHKPVIFAFHAYPWLIHRLTYRRTNHDNIHVRGYKEEGTITTPFDMTVLNDLDRFHLVMDTIDRLPQTGHAGIHLKRQFKDKLIEHKQYIDKNGQDMPEIRYWKWENPK